ncbi:MAG: 30S ribosomal protein S6e [Candidatus Woesearchaeota archaeon]
MAETKVNIGDKKTKKTYNKTLSEDQMNQIIGKKIGDKIKGESLELPGYEFEVVGGTDSAGFPMRKDVQGKTRKRILITGGVGMRKKERAGMRKRKLVAGNTIHENTAQINLKVTKQGKDPIEAPKEEASEEKQE